MQAAGEKLKTWWSGFRWSRLTRAAQLEIAAAEGVEPTTFDSSEPLRRVRVALWRELGPDGTATFDVGSVEGSGTWRVLALSTDRLAGPPGRADRPHQARCREA